MKEFKTGYLDWGSDIVQKYPLIYLENDDLTMKSFEDGDVNLRFGFEFREGWRDIVERFSEVASELVVDLRTFDVQKDAYIHACIFKEKFGKLVWQGYDNLIEPHNALLQAYIDYIEGRSSRTCEVCGSFGTIATTCYWNRCRCPEHTATK